MARFRLLLLASLLTAAPVRAQVPPDLTAGTALRDSLSRVTDSTVVARRERELLAVVRGNRGRAADHLRLGYVVLRLAELGRRPGYDEAAGEFAWVTRSEPAWASGWYGLGLAELGIASGQGSGLLASAALTPAARAFERAIAANPALADRLVDEAEQARRLGQRIRGRAFLEGLRRAAGREGRPAEVLAAQGRVERDFGDPNTALAAFDAWLPEAGRLAGLAHLEVARTRFLLGRRDGMGPYYDGAAVDLPVVVAEYRADLALIATPRELQDFDRASGGAREAFLRHFWRQRDRASLRPDGARLVEHYRRLDLARRLYPRASPGPSALLQAGVSLADHGLDDRGLVLVRHGEPDERVVVPAVAGGAESWRFRRAEGDLALEFAAAGGDGAYQLLEPVPSMVSPGPVPVMRSPGRPTAVRPVGSAAGQATLGAVPPSPGATFRPAERASYIVATTSDDYRTRFVHALGAAVDAVLFEPRGTGHALHLALAIPFDSLGAAWLGPAHEYPLRLRLGVFGADGEVVLALDSLVRPVTAEVGAARWLAGVVTVTLPPGRWRYRLELSDGDTLGTVLPVRAVEADAGGEAMALTDLAIGLRDTPWRQVVSRDGGAVRFLPSGVVERGPVVELGIGIRTRPGAVVGIEVTVARIDEAPHVALAWRRTLVADAPEIVVTEPLDTRRLRPGSYRVELAVRDDRGGVARRWREFAVGPDRGASEANQVSRKAPPTRH